jgi:aspartate aminotransferase-like enzyme
MEAAVVNTVAPGEAMLLLVAGHFGQRWAESVIVKALKTGFSATAAGGQGRTGNIIRIAHLGHYDAIDILGLLGALEIVLARRGHRVPPGAGSAAA